ncbi:MAG: DUF3540 domain-containing protein, partial [Deltaproteobacteria bacterium]|nr:DUF3540 domain-containing protein [Deltaproteobacteria bacterium]
MTDTRESAALARGPGEAPAAAGASLAEAAGALSLEEFIGDSPFNFSRGPVLAVGTLKIRGGAFSVAADAEEFPAAKAASCLVEPGDGDRVLALRA